jgi:hypothetical protein
VNYTVQVGLMAEGSDTEFDEDLGSLVNSQYIAPLFASSTKGDSTKMASAMILSHLQSLKYTRNWLPLVYNARQS